MTPSERLVIGTAAGLILCTLLNELFRWTPSWRDLLTATAAAVLIDLAINGQTRRDLGLVGIAATHPGDIAVFPHACPCAALAFIGLLAVLHVRQQR
jgi:hypothetical protein